MNYIIYGEEEYQRRKEISKILKKENFVDDMYSVIYMNVKEFTMEAVMEEAQTLPMFSDRKCIVLEECIFLAGQAVESWNLDDFVKWLNQIKNSVVFIMTGSFSKLDKRKKSMKMLVECCKTITCNPLKEMDLNKYVTQQLHLKRIKIDEEAKQLFLEKIPLDMQIIEKELDKLELYKDVITYEVIQSITIRSLEDNVFQLVDAIVKRNIKKSFSIWNDLQMLNKEPLHLLAVISSQFHLIYQVQNLMNQMLTQEAIAKNLQVHPYRVKLAMPIASSISADALLEILHRIAKLDLDIKSGKVDKKLGFEIFILNMKGI